MISNSLLAGLEPVFRSKVEDVIAACDDAGFRVVPYQGYRGPAEQARLWRQSRSRSEVEERVRLLRTNMEQAVGRNDKDQLDKLAADAKRLGEIGENAAADKP